MGVSGCGGRKQQLPDVLLAQGDLWVNPGEAPSQSQTVCVSCSDDDPVSGPDLKVPA